MQKTHLELQAMLIYIQKYNPTWLVGAASVMLQDLNFSGNTAGKWEDEPDKLVDLDTMHCTETALVKVSLPLKAWFVLVTAIHMQFDGGSQEGHNTCCFVILDMGGMKIIQAE